MVWPLDKLSVINQALPLTGNKLVAVADDGTDEWIVGSVAYEAAIEYVLEQGDWNFASAIQTLTKLPETPADTLYKDAYAKPQDALHIIWVRVNEVPADYKIVGNRIITNALTGTVTVKYIRQPTTDQVSPTFMAAVREFVKAGIYSGLNEDVTSAEKAESKGLGLLQQAKTRSSQEQPKRGLFNSRLRAARGVRRPWGSVPSRWGGTGIPS